MILLLYALIVYVLIYKLNIDVKINWKLFNIGVISRTFNFQILEYEKNRNYILILRYG